jgi:hypothetical protein
VVDYVVKHIAGCDLRSHPVGRFTTDCGFYGVTLLVGVLSSIGLGLIQCGRYLGPSVFAGILTMFILVPVNTICFNQLSKLRQQMLGYTDSRVKLSNEVLLVCALLCIESGRQAM